MRTGVSRLARTRDALARLTLARARLLSERTDTPVEEVAAAGVTLPAKRETLDPQGWLAREPWT